MRFIRLRIANYRGIAAAEVKLGPAGITLIQAEGGDEGTVAREALMLLLRLARGAA